MNSVVITEEQRKLIKKAEQLQDSELQWVKNYYEEWHGKLIKDDLLRIHMWALHLVLDGQTIVRDKKKFTPLEAAFCVAIHEEVRPGWPFEKERWNTILEGMHMTDLMYLTTEPGKVAAKYVKKALRKFNKDYALERDQAQKRAQAQKRELAKKLEEKSRKLQREWLPDLCEIWDGLDGLLPAKKSKESNDLIIFKRWVCKLHMAILHIGLSDEGIPEVKKSRFDASEARFCVSFHETRLVGKVPPYLTYQEFLYKAFQGPSKEHLLMYNRVVSEGIDCGALLKDGTFKREAATAATAENLSIEGSSKGTHPRNVRRLASLQSVHVGAPEASSDCFPVLWLMFLLIAAAALFLYWFLARRFRSQRKKRKLSRTSGTNLEEGLLDESRDTL